MPNDKSIEERLDRLEAVQEIHNVMGRYQYLLMGEQYDDLLNLWAQKVPDVSIEVYDAGAYIGLNRIKEFFIDALKGLSVVHGESMKKQFPDETFEKPSAGLLMEHQLVTPVIEVAGDGKTAKGVWSSPGYETFAVMGELQAFWVWGKYGVDFIKDDGNWKFWHFRIYKTFYTPFEKSWTEGAPTPFDAGIPGPEPDRPTKGDYTYSPTAVPVYAPVPPEPYEVFDNDKAY